MRYELGIAYDVYLMWFSKLHRKNYRFVYGLPTFADSKSRYGSPQKIVTYDYVRQYTDDGIAISKILNKDLPKLLSYRELENNLGREKHFDSSIYSYAFGKYELESDCYDVISNRVLKTIGQPDFDVRKYLFNDSEFVMQYISREIFDYFIPYFNSLKLFKEQHERTRLYNVQFLESNLNLPFMDIDSSLLTHPISIITN